jgi:hypothetical protein
MKICTNTKGRKTMEEIKGFCDDCKEFKNVDGHAGRCYWPLAIHAEEGVFVYTDDYCSCFEPKEPVTEKNPSNRD